MTSVHSSSLDTEEVDLSGLVESVVDSDEEDLAESMDVCYFAIYFIIYVQLIYKLLFSEFKCS